MCAYVNVLWGTRHRRSYLCFRENAGINHGLYIHLYINVYQTWLIYIYIYRYVQPIADRVALSLEIISKTF